MPDQYDPKVSPRPSSDRRPAELRRGFGGAEDDPLAELAKIVQGRPSASSSAAARAAPAKAPASNNATADLEAELLNDLQASFAAVRDALPTPPQVRDAAPAPVPVAAEQAEPEQEELPSIFQAPAPPPPEPAPAPQAVAPPRPEPRRELHPELRDEFRPEPFDETRFVPIPSPPVIQPQILNPPERPIERPAMERPPTERRVERAPEPPAAEPIDRAPRPSRQPPATEARTDLGSFQLRGSAGAPAMAPPPVRQPHSRWEKPEPPKPQSASASRFAPPRAAPPVPADDEVELDPFAEGGLFAELDEPGEPPDEFPLEGFGTVPSYGDDEQLPPFEDELDKLARRRGPSRSLIIVGAVAAIALVGGVAVAMLNSGGSATGAPPIITADGGPTKITPADTASGDADAQNKLIYDRVNSSETSGDTTLVTPGDGPIKDVATNDTSNPISRVIIPGGPGIDQPASGDAIPLDQAPGTAPADAGTAVAANDAAAGDSIQAIGPRKVRTVVVKPDGTILSSNATDAGAGTNAPADTTTAAPPATTTATAPPATAPPADAPPTEITDDTAAIAGNGGQELTITPAPDGTAAPADTATAGAGTSGTQTATQPPPVEAPPVAKPVVVTTKPVTTKPAKTQVATADSEPGPLDLTAGAQAPAATSGGTLVQISSQRSEDAARATYRDLQARYPNILGRYDVNIQRADVQDRGTFYRVRVGPFSQGDAQRLCDDLRSAGGDCVLAKR